MPKKTTSLIIKKTSILIGGWIPPHCPTQIPLPSYIGFSGHSESKIGFPNDVLVVGSEQPLTINDYLFQFSLLLLITLPRLMKNGKIAIITF